jgi:hypothetical protein
LEKGYDSDYPCDLHEGRTALGEICLKTTVYGGEQTYAAYETLKLFSDASSALNPRVQVKTVLHLVLENDKPVEITLNLLHLPKTYKDIQADSELSIYEDEQGSFMSPAIYAQRYCKSGEYNQSGLIRLPKEKRCKEEWFITLGNQLVEPRGLPPALKVAMAKQDLADQAEERAIRRCKQSAKIELEFQQESHRTNIMQSKEQANLVLLNHNV